MMFCLIEYIYYTGKAEVWTKQQVLKVFQIHEPGL